MKYLISYQRRSEDENGIRIWDEQQIEVETREEADQKADELQTKGYENIIIEPIKE